MNDAEIYNGLLRSFENRGCMSRFHPYPNPVSVRNAIDHLTSVIGHEWDGCKGRGIECGCSYPVRILDAARALDRIRTLPVDPTTQPG